MNKPINTKLYVTPSNKKLWVTPSYKKYGDIVSITRETKNYGASDGHTFCNIPIGPCSGTC